MSCTFFDGNLISRTIAPPVGISITKIGFFSVKLTPLRTNPSLFGRPSGVVLTASLDMRMPTSSISSQKLFVVVGISDGFVSDVVSIDAIGVVVTSGFDDVDDEYSDVLDGTVWLESDEVGSAEICVVCSVIGLVVVVPMGADDVVTEPSAQAMTDTVTSCGASSSLVLRILIATSLTFSIGNCCVGSDVGAPRTEVIVSPDLFLKLTSIWATLFDGNLTSRTIAPLCGIPMTMVNCWLVKSTPLLTKSSLLK